MDEDDLNEEDIRAIAALSQLDMAPDNLRECAALCRRVTVYYLNTSQFDDAGSYCINGINYLWQIKQHYGELSDDDYRNLIDLYLDLSDIYAELSNIYHRDEAISYALQAFHEIRLKTPDEKSIGDPRVNFSQFYNHFQQKICTPGLVGSSEYKNNQSLISETVQNNALLGNFSQHFFLNPDEQALSDLQKNIDSISLSAIPKTFVFIAETDDQSYRVSGAKLQILADMYQQNGLNVDARKTYGKAISALENIRMKTEEDYLVMRKMNDNIMKLTIKSRHSSFFKQSDGFLTAIVNDEVITNDMFMMDD